MNRKCAACDHELEVMTEYQWDEEDNMKTYICPHCGRIYDVELTVDEDKQYYHHYNDDVNCTISDENHGYEFKCTECGHYVIITNNFMRSEVYGDVDEEETDENGLLMDDAIVDILHCPNCGASITVVPPKPSEEKNYPAYNNNEKK